MKTKTIFFSLLIVISFSSCIKKTPEKECPVIAIGNLGCTISLPYEIGENTTEVFSPDSTVALDVLELSSDGYKLEMIRDVPFNVSPSPISIINAFPKNDCYMLMSLKGKKEDSYYLWNDGRGIISAQGEKNVWYSFTNSYLIPTDTKELKIIYRVLLPSPNIDIKSLYTTLPKNGNFTKTYTATISLINFTININQE